MFEKFENFNHKVSNWFEWVGLTGILLMMVITCIDVVGAKVFQWRLFGAIDIVMLSQIVAISFATSMSLILGRHIKVEFFIMRIPIFIQGIINCIVFILELCLFGLIIWRLFELGYSFQTSGEMSQTADIPYFPFAYGIAIASVPIVFILLSNFFKSFGRIIRK